MVRLLKKYKDIKRRIKKTMEEMLRPKIKNYIIRYDDVIVNITASEIKCLLFPKDFDSNVAICLDNNQNISISLTTLKDLLDDKLEKNQYKQHYDDIKYILQDDSDNLKFKDFTLCTLENFTDITDFEFNNFESIEKSNIISNGLWIGNGIRKIQLTFDEKSNEFRDFINKYDNVTAKLVLNKKDNNDLDEKISFNIEQKNNEFIIIFDTDKMIQFFEDNIDKHSFYGNIIIKTIDENQFQYSFLFPFEIKLTNPKCTSSHIKNDYVSIDFGTSSTCVATNKGKELISFNDNPKTIEDYENMTSLIIYNWQELYKQWTSTNNTLPYFIRSKNEAEKIDEYDHYDYSHNVKWELENAPDAKTMDAIITNLKSIPGLLEDNKNSKLEIKPFDKWKNKIYLTDTNQDENEEIFNPIAFYGYLIGRSLNLQIKDKIYTNYTLTIPVKFNKYQREKIIESLKYGLSRSIPKTLKDQIKINDIKEEPVALLGVAAKKLKVLKPKENTLFAVFDFGGGTLDFAFGMYRKSSEDEKIALFDDEYNRYKNILEIFKTDGVKIGGETLIEKLSWHIYTTHREEMEKENIVMLKPDGEKDIKNFPAKLNGKRHIDYVNLKTLNETFSRYFLINGEFSQKDEADLFSVDNYETPKTIKFDSLNEEKADELLRDIVTDLVENFKNIIEITFEAYKDRLALFEKEEVNIDDIVILQAGNTCKAKWVKEAFEDIFKDHKNIEFIQKDDITPKNAVAKGALMLDGVGVYNHTRLKDKDVMPLDRYIWNIEDIEDEGEDATAVLKNGDTQNKGFVYCSRRDDNGVFTIYYSSLSSLEDEDDDNLYHHTFHIPSDILEENKYRVFVKPYDGRYIECVLAKDIQGSDIDESKKMILDIEKGEITK